MPRIPRFLAFSLVFSTCALIAATGLAQPPSAPPCVVEDPNPGVGGRFEAVISGADPLATELAGFATSSGGAGVTWSLQLLTPGGENSILLVTEGVGRPAPGTYRVANYAATDASPPKGQYIALVALADDILGATGFSSVKGTLTVVSSSSSAVAGCFDFSAVSQGTPGPRVAVAGTFAAGNKDY